MTKMPGRRRNNIRTKTSKSPLAKQGDFAVIKYLSKVKGHLMGIM